MVQKVDIFWFRRDLRLKDNAGLFQALNSGQAVLPIFIFDKVILKKLPSKQDARVEFIMDSLLALRAELKAVNSDLLITFGKPEDVFKQLLAQYDIETVFANRDYEPYARKRDQNVELLLSKHDVKFLTFKDHVILEFDEVLKADGTPYIVFTPYSRKWRAKVEGDEKFNSSKNPFLKAFPSEQFSQNFFQYKSNTNLSLADIGFEKSNINFPARQVKQALIRAYQERRNFPSVAGTSKLGIHFRFGTISIREKVKKAWSLSHTYVNELIWRDFYAQILANYPHVAEGCFREKYEQIEWRNNEQEFEAWCNGMTGYPIVDAGMRELNATGFMHNRVRMITASFLTKHLLIDWRWGEAYFAEKLLDFDLASNNGGWQWAAGCGTDAAPYFRIFNPYTQREKFDKEWLYCKKWIPELNSEKYPEPIVDHKMARERCLEVYKSALAQNV